uniref:Uncharacterized protein n=1 Tax=Ascaris lumbricoides TaxID=6252 RepID=A0A0M3I922_ASCLU
MLLAVSVNDVLTNLICKIKGPLTLQMEQPRFSISAITNGVPYRRRPNRSKSEDLTTTRIRIATIYMNNEH